MHGYGMEGWNMGWIWLLGLVVVIIALALIFRPRR